MATRRPLVLVAGSVQELPTGDVFPVPRAFPFFLASGTQSDIDLTTASALPFFLASGSASNIPLTL